MHQERPRSAAAPDPLDFVPLREFPFRQHYALFLGVADAMLLAGHGLFPSRARRAISLARPTTNGSQPRVSLELPTDFKNLPGQLFGEKLSRLNHL